MKGKRPYSKGSCRRIKRNPPTKLDFSMSKAGDKYIGEMEFQKKGGDFDLWTVIKRGRIYLIGTATNTGLLSEYYYEMDAGESEQNALEEINADLEWLATDGPSYMSRVTKIPRKISTNRRRGLRRNPMRRTVSKVGLIDFIKDTYQKRDDYNYPENKRWLNRILGKVKKLKAGVYDIQVIQNMLRDLRDADPGDDDNYWYLIIDGIDRATGIGPQ